MNNHEMAQAMLKRAAAIMEEAHFLYERAYWNLVVRRCQETVESALKAALIWAGIEVPRSHDVGPWLRREVHRFPEFFSKGDTKVGFHFTSLTSRTRVEFLRR
ncbi:HEPN domain-containing protein [Thermodesulforhabdus norvegica]|uniref:HEPN domain-containing protein n=1 Tax=Thermodesulforhabdus norvegica TaxID=39841 RepID=A0A1I4VEW3_9BACT|nr:HEPN domain-containing protein [Thermodesulforhabdus norvegica]SFM99666.1 HEPN domain-containing protein [Thermodesulforhabdus norvegica]